MFGFSLISFRVLSVFLLFLYKILNQNSFKEIFWFESIKSFVSINYFNPRKILI